MPTDSPRNEPLGKKPPSPDGEENPYASPQTVADGHRSKPRTRATLLALGILLTPVAALIGGFCCCTVGYFAGGAISLTIGGGYGPPVIGVYLGSLVGLIGGGVLCWRRLHKQPTNDEDHANT
ncbi:MAG: hypothetical protein AAGF31_08135 [Planctomycetota bacterium]